MAMQMNGEPTIVAMGLKNGRPSEIYVAEGADLLVYEAEYCRRDDTLYYELYMAETRPATIHMEGCEAHWLADGCRAVACPGADIGMRVAAVPEAWDTWEKFRTEAIEVDTVYCSICADYLPTGMGDLRESPAGVYHACDHVRWEDAEGLWMGEGYDG